MTSCYVFQINVALSERLKFDLENMGFIFAKPIYTLFQAKKKGLSLTLYESGKLMVQGKEATDFIQSYLEPEILQTFTVGYEHLSYDLTPRIGVDESGKGDFFGPLCIAGVFAQDKDIQNLAEIGVKDSKKLSDSSILKIADKIKKQYSYHIVKISPKKYNELYDKFGNLNLLLGWGHATVIDYLLDKSPCEKIIIDQFAGEHVVENALKKKKRQNVRLFQRPRAEEDLVVAAASILARSAFVSDLQTLEKEIGVKLPKGASKMVVDAGKQIVAKFGPDALNQVAKLHFKTRVDILG